MSYTQEELDVMAQLGVISNKVLNIGFPRDVVGRKKVAEARRYAAVELNKLGYSTRQIAQALGLKSPQSVMQYLEKS